MIPIELSIQSYRKTNPAPRNELHAVTEISGEIVTASIISMIDKTEQMRKPEQKAGPKGWVMPPIVRAYLRARDNDPL